MVAINSFPTFTTAAVPLSLTDFQQTCNINDEKMLSNLSDYECSKLNQLLLKEKQKGSE
jgi:hypothetical protein